MFDAVGCLTNSHDARLVILAALNCTLASLVVVRLMRHAASQTGHTRAMWLAICSLAGGAGVWATHFIAMLAYDPGLPSGYAFSFTLASFIIAVATIGAGLTVSLTINAFLGGAIVGVGVAAMHLVGMAGFEAAALMVWHAKIVAVAIAFSVGISGLALCCSSTSIASRKSTIAWVTPLATPC